MKELFDKLLLLSVENEVVEFKEAKKQFDKDKLGQYFSALANEANLKGQKQSWLIFGVKNDKSIVGTSITDKQINDYKAYIGRQTSPQCTFVDVYPIEKQGKKVLLFEIPATPQGQPMRWQGHCYGRDGETLVALSGIEYDKIKSQTSTYDWSKQIVENATIADLSKTAIDFSRIQFKEKNPKLKEEIDNWTDKIFLDKAKITIKGKINVVESEDGWLVYSNLGEFIPNSVEEVVFNDHPEEKYRNKWLADAMVTLKMIDTTGSGIKKMYTIQRNKLFPLPDYDLTNHRVRLKIFGKMINLDYALKLAEVPDLSFAEIIALDKLAKQKSLTDAEAKELKERKLIEGRKPNYFISAKISQVVEEKAEYSKNKAFEKEKYFDWILKSIKEHGSMSRKDIDKLLWNIMPVWMSEEQKKNRVMNLIQELGRNGKIINKGTRFSPKWIIP
jgi:predicted HTH transcriptional regulator